MRDKSIEYSIFSVRFFFFIVLILKEYNVVKSIGQSNQLRGEKRYITSFQLFSFSLDLSSSSSSSYEQLYKEEKKIGKQVLMRAKNRSRQSLYASPIKKHGNSCQLFFLLNLSSRQSPNVFDQAREKISLHRITC